jgi:hypothetical protein
LPFWQKDLELQSESFTFTHTFTFTHRHRHVHVHFHTHAHTHNARIVQIDGAPGDGGACICATQRCVGAWHGGVLGVVGGGDAVEGEVHLGAPASQPRDDGPGGRPAESAAGLHRGRAKDGGRVQKCAATHALASLAAPDDVVEYGVGHHCLRFVSCAIQLEL